MRTFGERTLNDFCGVEDMTAFGFDGDLKGGGGARGYFMAYDASSML